MSIAREIAPAKYRDALALLKAHGVPISATVTAATKELDRVENLKPVYVTAADLAAAYRDPKATAAQLVNFATEVYTITARSEGWRNAWTGAALAGLRTIAAEVGDIVEYLRPTAEAHLDVLRWYAEAGSPDVAVLVRERRTDDAQKAATAPVAFAAWEALVTMRRDLSGARFDWSRAGRWSNPEHVAANVTNRQLTGLDHLTAGIRAGGRLWWPSIDQAAEVTGRVVDAEDKAQVEEFNADRLQKQSAF